MKQTDTLINKKHTVKDYKKLNEGAPYELINGMLVEEPSPTYGHQAKLRDIFNQIFNYLKENSLGETLCAPLDVYFDEENVFQPDIVFVSNIRKHIIHEDGIHGSPDLIIEILSPATAFYDLNEKKRNYEKYGVKEYWVIDPENEKVIGYENINGEFIEFYSGYGKFSSKVLNLDISVQL